MDIRRIQIYNLFLLDLIEDNYRRNTETIYRSEFYVIRHITKKEQLQVDYIESLIIRNNKKISDILNPKP